MAETLNRIIIIVVVCGFLLEIEGIRRLFMSLLSVIIINRSNYDKTLISLDEQNYDDMEILIADVAQFGGDALNNCIFQAAGDYILFLDSKVILEPSVLANAVNTAVTNNLDIYLCPNSDIQIHSSFIFTEHDVITGNHDAFFLSGLMDNCINIYKKSLIDKLRFGYGSSSEYLIFNIHALEKVSAIGYDPRPFWSGDIYPGYEGYASYHHNIFNEEYLRIIEILARDHMISDERIGHYRNRRMNQFLTQLDQYIDAPLTLEEGLYEIFAITNDIKEFFDAASSLKFLEERVLYTCSTFISTHEGQDAGVMNFALSGLKEIFKAGDVSKQDIDPGVIASMVIDYLNPANIGMYAYQSITSSTDAV